MRLPAISSFEPTSRPAGRHSLPWALAALAVILRLPHLGWGLPELEEEALPLKKAFDMWGWLGDGLQLDPQTAGWPSFSFYVHLAVQKLHYGLGRLFGQFENPYDYWVAFHLDPTPQVLAARLLAVLLGAGIVWIGTRLGHRLAGWPGALAAGSLLLVSPMAIRHSQMVEPDILLVFFAALSLWKIFDVVERGRTRDYIWAAIWAGLGAASKYTPVLLTLSLYVAHLYRLKGEEKSLAALGLGDRRLGYAALAALLAFCLASPYTFANLDVLRRDFSYQALHMSRGHFGHESRRFGYGYYLSDVLARAFGWPALILGLSGMIVAYARGGIGRVALLGFVPFFVGLGALSTQFSRYMLPALLPLSLGCGALIGWAIGSRKLASWQWVILGIAWAAVLWFPARGTLRYFDQQSVQSTQQLAKKWVEETFEPDDTYFVLEQYGPSLPTDDRDALKESKIYEFLGEEQRQILLARPYYKYQIIPMYSTRSELTEFFYDLRHFLAYDYVVVSSSVKGRYRRDRESFPRQNQFYDDLERFAEEAKVFTPKDAGRGPAIWFYRMTTEGRDALKTERGTLPRDFCEPYLEKVFPPHFLAFLENVAAHAYEQDEFEIAELYYEQVHKYAEEPARSGVLVPMAYANLRAGRYNRARRDYMRILSREPNNVVALGNLGYVMLQLEDIPAARQYLERCLQVTQDPDAREWAQSLLDEVNAGERAP